MRADVARRPFTDEGARRGITLVTHVLGFLVTTADPQPVGQHGNLLQHATLLASLYCGCTSAEPCVHSARPPDCLEAVAPIPVAAALRSHSLTLNSQLLSSRASSRRARLCSGYQLDALWRPCFYCYCALRHYQSAMQASRRAALATAVAASRFRLLAAAAWLDACQFCSCRDLWRRGHHPTPGTYHQTGGKLHGREAAGMLTVSYPQGVTVL